MRHTKDTLINFYINACCTELESLKPSNVHIYRDGHDMGLRDFVRAAECTAPVLLNDELSCGIRMVQAAQAVKDQLGHNVNIGIILLCAPLLHVALHHDSSAVRSALADYLRTDDDSECHAIMRAIAIAAPSGLGRAPQHDVREPPQVPLREVMASAAHYDLIAHQYAHDFADVFDGAHFLHEQKRLGISLTEATLRNYLRFLATHMDSHIVRQHGIQVAHDVQNKAAQFRHDMTHDSLHQWDRDLKERHINAGTSADMTVASQLLYDIIHGVARKPHYDYWIKPLHANKKRL